MSHIFIMYCQEDVSFATQLAVQLQQRGLVVEPLPDPADPRMVLPEPDSALLEGATHVLLLYSPVAAASEAVTAVYEQALGERKHILVATRDETPLPRVLQPVPLVDFRRPFLLAVEDLVHQLKLTGAPTRQLTVEHPMFKPDLLPSSLPSERCLRDDRMRINYALPMVFTEEELAARLPAFFAAAGFTPVADAPQRVTGERTGAFSWFDPRRAQQTLSVFPHEGALLARYQMTRLQATFWFPAHYHVLDREAAALFRYLATGSLDEILWPVVIQARISRMLSWLTVVLTLLVALTIVYLVLWQVFDVSLF